VADLSQSGRAQTPLRVGPVLMVGTCQVELTAYGFHVTREGVPVPDKVHPPAVLTFASKSHARAYATAIDGDDADEAHRLIDAHGRWWR
jgi:hypothetical protein